MADSNQTWQIDPKGLSVEEIAKLTGYSPSGLRGWKNMFKIPVIVDGKKDLYMEEGQRLMQLIIGWKKENKSPGQIYDLLAEQGHVVKTRTFSEAETEATQVQQLQQLALEQIEVAVSTALEKQAETHKQVLENQSELSKLYGNTTYQLGQRDERISNLLLEVDRLNDQVKLLPAAVTDLEREKRDLEFEIRQLKQQMESETTRTSDVAATNQKLQEQLQKLTGEHSKSMSDLSQLEISFKSVTSEKETLQSQVQKLEQQLATQKQATQTEKETGEQALEKVKRELEQERERRKQAEEALEAEKKKGVIKKLFGG